MFTYRQDSAPLWVISQSRAFSLLPEALENSVEKAR